MKKKYQICKQCVMDNASDETITFNNKGVCNYCSSAYDMKASTYFPNKKGENILKDLIVRLKKEGENKKYDCLMGISGGLDSSYLLYLGSKWGLRILALHVDDGFNSDISESNIEKLIKATNVDYIVKKPDRVQYNALVKAYIKAGVPNLAVPQDNILFAHLYKYAREYKIKNFLSGGNFALESILQKGNTYRAFDIVNIKSIHKKFGSQPIDKLPLLSDFRRFIDQNILKVNTYRPLNYIDYNRNKALKELNEFCSFEYYGSKHLENTLTKFIQVYWFYNKFKVDKRRSHLSSMIVSGQISRAESLVELEKPIYDEEGMNLEILELCNALNISKSEFEHIMNEKTHQHEEYGVSSFYKYFDLLMKMKNVFSK